MINKNKLKLNKDEKIIEILHRNWFYIFKQFVLVFLLMVSFFLGLFMFIKLFPLSMQFETAKVLLLVENIFMIMIWIFGFMVWIDYYFDVWVITDQRIINYEQKGLFVRIKKEIKISQIKQIEVDVVGKLASIMNYGDLNVSSEKTNNKIIFRTISDPYRIKKLIEKVS